MPIDAQHALDEYDPPNTTKPPEHLLRQHLSTVWANRKIAAIVRLPTADAAFPPSSAYAGWRLYYD